MKNYEYILFDVEDDIGVLTINNPKSLNALNRKTLEEVKEVVSSIKAGEVDVKFLLVTGAGEKSFVAGADIKEMAEMSTLEAQTFSKLGNEVNLLIENLSIPTLAVVNGYALGGGLELAMSCDLRFASDNALVGLPEVGLGLIPGFGGTQRLSRIIGLPKAKELVFSAENLKANQALEIGLFNRVFDKETLMDEAKAYAQKVTKQGQIAVQTAKEIMNAGYEMTVDQGVELEVKSFGLLLSTEDYKEGTQAFIESRKPNFKNK